MHKYTANDIAKILHMDDNISDFFPCDKGEWVQWLMSIVDDPRFLIIGTDKSYLVAVNSIQRPVSDHVFILMCFSKDGSVQELKDCVTEWAVDLGAKKVQFIAKDLETFESYDVEQYGIIGGWGI